MRMDFECFEDGRWYVVLPEYQGSQEDLEMVEGADDMLRALTADGLYVSLDIDPEQPSAGDYFTLKMEAHDDDGAHYNVMGCDKFSDPVWLCNVVHVVFREHPPVIYCSVIE